MCKVHGKTSGVLLDANALPYSDKSFDLILVGDVLEYGVSKMITNAGIASVNLKNFSRSKKLK